MANTKQTVGGGPEWMKNQQADKANKNTGWTQMMQMMAMMPKMTDQQMIGFGLGKLLKDGWLNWKGKREDEQKRRADLAASRKDMTANTAPYFNAMQQQNVDDGMKQIFGDYTPAPANPYQLSAPSVSDVVGYNPGNIVTVEQAVQASSPLSAWDEQMKKSLGM